MKILQSAQRRFGFTFLDLIIVLALLGILVTWHFAFRPRRHHDGRVPCVSNLKQIGLAARIWASDHDEKFPWQVSQAEGGTKEYINTPETFVHFLAMSNEMNTPKILWCREDFSRSQTNNWQAFSNAHLSYFVGLDADATRPQVWLSGDRTLSTNRSIMAGMLTVNSNTPVAWAPGIHKDYGFIGLSDGSVEQVANSNLKTVLPKDDSAFRIVMP